MSTAAAPALETGGGSSTPVTATNVDPIDALNLSDTVEVGATPLHDFPIAESMILGGKREAEAAEETETVATDRGDGRTADGKFAKKGEEPATPEATTATPFKYRAMAQTHELEGATVDTAGNVLIPAAKVPELREAFNARHLAQGHFQPVLEKKEAENVTLRQQLAEFQETRSLADTKAEQLVSALTEAMTDPNDESALNRLWALRQSWDKLTAKAEATYWQNEAKRGKTAATPKAEAPTQPQSPSSAMPAPDDAKATTREHIEQMKVDHTFRGITQEDWKQFEADAEAKPFAYLRLATAQDATQFPGVQAGQVVFDTDMLTAAVQQFATRRTSERETAEQSRRLAADNARRTQPSVNAPPTPGGARAPSKANRGPAFTNAKDVEAWLNSDEL